MVHRGQNILYIHRRPAQLSRFTSIACQLIEWKLEKLEWKSEELEWKLEVWSGSWKCRVEIGRKTVNDHGRAHKYIPVSRAESKSIFKLHVLFPQ